MADRLRRCGPLLVVLAVVAALAARLRTNGLDWGDDWTLYVRQARSLLDGNIGQVIADNHVNVDNAARPGFSPYVYPWGWPLLLAPFVRLWGLDPARLKLIEVACLCGFLAFFHAVIVRRTAPAGERAGRWLALAVVAAVGTSLAYLQHAGQLLSEYPYMLVAAATLWSLDRCRSDGPLDAARRAQLVTLGLLAAATFNVRREGAAMIVAIAATQLVEVRGRWRTAHRRSVATPYVVFVVGVVGFQLLLPSVLAPSYPDAGLHQTWRKLHGPFNAAFGTQLGFDHLAGFALVMVVAFVAGGIVLRLNEAPADDIALVVFAVGSMVIVGMIPAVADRYLLAITPFAIYFAAQAIAGLPWPRHLGRWIATAAVGALVALHATDLPERMRLIDRVNAAGVQDGPLTASSTAAFDAVRTHTHQSDVVAFFKARALTLFTDRRAVQSIDLQVLRERSDFFLARRGSSFSQPFVTDEQAARMGWTAVWQDERWVLWQLPRLRA